MAKKLKNFEFRTNARDSMPWEEWLDGNIWQLTKGEDFDRSVESIRSGAFVKAKAMGLKVRTSVKENTIVIQAYKPEDSE